MNKKISVLLIITMIFSMLGGLPFSVDDAYGLSYGDYSIIEELSSTNNSELEYFKVKTPQDEDNAIYIYGKLLSNTELINMSLKSCDDNFDTELCVFVKPDENGEFHIKIDTTEGNKETPEIIDSKGSVMTGAQCYDTIPGYVAVPEIKEGFYRLVFTKAVTIEDADVSASSYWWEGPLGGNYGYIWKDCMLVAQNSNNLKLISFDNVISQGNTVRKNLEASELTIDSYIGSYKRYLDTSLADVNYLFNTDDTKPFEGLNEEQISYIKNLAEKITFGASTDYEKLVKIYEYVSSNFYYDRYAFYNKEHQLGNPYDNLYALNNGGNNANVNGNKVGVVCDGYSSIFIALARAENIPARMVSGIALATKENWSNVTNLHDDTHWWAEAYVDGEWITIDAERGSLNSWDRSSVEDVGVWTKQKYISYSSFDINPVTCANTYLLNNVIIGSRDRSFLCFKNELNQLNSLLKQEKDQISNGKKLNPNYNSSDLSTWGPEEYTSTLGDGYGRVYQLIWSDKDLEGVADFSGFKKIKYLYLGGNELKSINLDGCVELNEFSAFGNDLSTFNSVDSINLKSLDLRANPLEDVAFLHNNNLINISAENGSFSMKYNTDDDKSLTIYADDPGEGLVYKGIFNEENVLITTDKEYSFNPKDTKYRVIFEDNSANLLKTPVVTASNNPWTGNITLNWEPIDGAEFYYIYRSEQMDGKYELWYTCDKNEYVNTTSNLGDTYYFKVRAGCSDDTITSFSSTAVAATKILGCPSLNYTKLDEASGGISLHWDIVEDADIYVVYRSTEEFGEYTEIGKTSNLEYLDTTGTVNVRYYYKVKAINNSNSAIDSLYSNTAYRTVSCAKPTIKSFNNLEGTPFIQWEAVKEAENYSVYYLETIESTPKWVAYAPTCTYMAKELSFGEKGYYQVRAFKGDSYSVYSDVVSATRTLSVPTNVKVNNVASSGKPKITWTAVEGADKYYVYRSTSKDGAYSYLGSTVNTNYTNTGATAGVCYYYKVKAVLTSNEEGNSIQSDYCYITCDLQAPTNVKVSNVAASGKPKITWTAVTGANKYYVYRSTSKDGTYSYLGSTTNTYYTNTGAVAGNSYYYKVKAVMTSNDNATSAHSNYCSINCDLATPKNVKVSNVASSGKPNITWSSVDGANKYYIYRSTSADGPFNFFDSTTKTSYTNTGATAGTCYYYKVKAVMTSNENATSAQSGYCYITCDLATPTNVKVSNVASSGKPKVTWTAVTGANKYYVYRSTSKDGTYSYSGSTANTHYTNTGAVAGTCYYYKVKAVMTSNENATSAQSSYAYITCDLARPTNVNITLSNNKPKITWTAVSGASKYEVYRKVGESGTYSKFYTTTSTSFTNTGAVKGTKYYYKIVAVCGTNSYGNSVYSSEVSITSK